MTYTLCRAAAISAVTYGFPIERESGFALLLKKYDCVCNLGCIMSI